MDEEDILDDICSSMENTKVKFHEGNELYSFYNKEKYDIHDVYETDDRYQRYLRGIDCWIRGGKSYEYIRDGIMDYLKYPTNLQTIDIKIKLMKIIDLQIINVLEKKI
jgi:hypothetical protein